MSIARVLSAVGGILRLFSVALLLPIPVAFAYDAWDTPLFGVEVPRNAFAFLASAALAGLAWLPLQYFTRKVSEDDMLDREAYLTVGIGWLAVTLFGMVPFLLSGTLGSPVDAFFETMSGLTGTGNTVIPDVDGAARSILFWRALTQWLGGLGIIVLMVALLFKLTHGGLLLFQAEAAGHSTRIKPKLAETARILLTMYAFVTVAFTLALFLVLHYHTGLAGKDAAFDAVAHVFTGYATGGYSTHTDSIRFFQDPWVDWLLTFMMLTGGTNFTLAYFFLRKGQWRPLVRSAEWRFYIGAYLLVATAVALVLLRHGGGADSVRHAAFNAASLYTGTGFASVDYAQWAQPALLLLLLLMLMGGMAGSTSSAVKSFRWVILGKLVARELRRLKHPRAVIPVRLGERTLSETAVSTLVAFFFSYMALFTLGTWLMTMLEPVTILEGSSIVASSLGNVGGGFGSLGPYASPGTAGLGDPAKLLLSAIMWFGRLEIFAVLLVFTPSSWRN